METSHEHTTQKKNFPVASNASTSISRQESGAHKDFGTEIIQERTIGTQRLSQLADSLSSDALEQLAKDFKQDKISAERVLAAASNAKSHSVASELKRLRLKQEMEGVLTSSQAIEAANHFASELLEAIRDICYHFKIDGEEFIQRMMNRHDQIIEETILAKADQLAKDRLAEGHYKELLNE